MTDRQGQQLDNYRLIRRLGAGSFGEVYLAEHVYRRAQAPVAIKVLPPLAQGELGSFLTEARTAFLRHASIVQVLDFGVEKGTPFIVMEYAPNGTLRQRHPKGTRVSLPTIVSYVKQIASALQYAHNERLVHRDIKPENMLIGEQNQILLSDFGIATIVRSGMSSQNAEDKMVGTILYMSPEQIQSYAHPASDQYSLGIVVYEWLCGKTPFQGTCAEIVAKHAMASPPPLCDRMSTIAPDVERVVMKALAKDPRQRFDSVSTFAKALEQACAGTLEYTTRSVQPEPATVVVPGSPSRESTAPTIESTHKLTRPRTSRRKVVLGLGAGLVVVATAGGFAWLKFSHPSKPPPPPIPQGKLFYIYSKHSASVNAVAWSPDGKHIASGSDDKKVQVWDAANGRQAFIYSGHSDLVEAVAWSPNSKRIVSGSFDTTAQVWDATSGGNVVTYGGHSKAVYAVAWSPDGKYIASGSYDKTVQIWDTSNGNLIYTYTGHAGSVHAVAWSPDGKRIASGSYDMTVQVWDAANGGNVVTYHGHSNIVLAVAWSPDSKRVVSSAGINDTRVQVWDAADARQVCTYAQHSAYVNAVAWSHDGKQIASGAGDNTVQIWNAANGNHIYTCPRHASEVTAVAWSPDDEHIVSGNHDHTVQVWQAR